MTEFREPLEVPVVRTLLALLNWPDPKNVRARPTLDALASMDFMLRFPAILEAAFAEQSRELPADARVRRGERLALENDQPVAQLAMWPSQHRLVIGVLLGRQLARRQPAVAGSGLALTGEGARIAAAFEQLPEWSQTSRRARALGRVLRVGGPRLVSLTRRAAERVQEVNR